MEGRPLPAFREAHIRTATQRPKVVSPTLSSTEGLEVTLLENDVVSCDLGAANAGVLVNSASPLEGHPPSLASTQHGQSCYLGTPALPQVVLWLGPLRAGRNGGGHRAGSRTADLHCPSESTHRLGYVRREPYHPGVLYAPFSCLLSVGS